jgi:predicted transposase YdaD
MSEHPYADYDSPWKEILEQFFPEFMAFYFPEAHRAIDWDQGYEFLDKELQQVVREAETGRRQVDKLVRVNLLGSGAEAWVLIHVEVQGDQDADFAKRMYVYNYRLFDRYGRRIASFAILTDDNPAWRPERFAYDLLGCRVALDFPTIKLLDYEQRWTELEASLNPFAVVSMAHLQTRRTRKQAQERYAAKLRLARLLYERKYSRADILELFRFIDWVMTLPPELEERFMSDIVAYEARERRPYVSSVERIAIQRGLAKGIEQGIELGREKGREEGMRVMLLESLEARFGAVPEVVTVRLEAISDRERLRKLLRLALAAETMMAFTEQIDS